MTLFLVLNAVFVAVFVALALMHPPIWVWVLFVVAWCVADYVVAKDIHLAWWHWALLLVGLSVIDVVVLYATGQI